MDITVDWSALRAAAVAAMQRAYAPYSGFAVGAAALVDDGRTVSGCNVENASYGLTLCAECGLVSALHASGGGRLVAMSCVDSTGAALMPCGRCRQLLWEHAGPDCEIDSDTGPIRLVQLLPHAFDAVAMKWSPGEPGVPARLREWQGSGIVFVHPDSVGGAVVWTAYWQQDTEAAVVDRHTILEEGPVWTGTAEAVAWGRQRTPRVVVVDTAGELRWAGTGEPPADIPVRWRDG
jgi:cytidine deaminase